MRSFLASRPVVVLLIAALMLRLGMAVAVQLLLDHKWQRQFVIAGDAEGYWLLGQAIANGEPYALYHPPRFVMRMPGFPVLLAVPIKLFQAHFLATRLFLAVVGAAVCGLVYLLGRELLDERIALWAGWFTAVSPVMVGFSVMILSETPFALGLVGSLWAFACLMRVALADASFSRLFGWAIVTGLFVALATYMRPSWLPMAVVFPAGLFVAAKFCGRAAIAGVVLAATVFVAMWPWAYRNHQVTGHWIFTTLWSGPSLFDGLNPEATGESNMDFFDRDQLMQRMSEYEVNRHYWEAGMDYARQNPGRAVQLGFLKLWRFWKPWPGAEEAGNWASKSLMAGFSVILFAGVLSGIWLYRRNLVVLSLTLGPVLFFSVLHSLFVGSLRYRLPAEYPMAVLAAAGWLAWGRHFGWLAPRSPLGPPA